ncbi:ferredoxin III, nif-specific [Vibrio sp. 10N.286.49.B3]|uniref:ferredoxin III, nif-specific n=1 Tax=Vibrio sp. 10N.286.49.B3 TaxID=1880855 RepID=UPI000C82A72B|nr:ferredoxin III, nif-specific [Vibrio sp. 10N.286.49.B3]PMH44850.1 ferredoxin III, nif-specific [Vibrio sp. 10N.286.49.B3]
MAKIAGQTRGGAVWDPQFIDEVNANSCIGCGRCYKVCSRDVFDLIEKEDVDDDDDMYDDYDDDQVMMVMATKDKLDCVGCGSCAKVCPKNCHSFEAGSALA